MSPLRTAAQKRLGELFGWNFPPARQSEFEAGLQRASDSWKFASVDSFCRWLVEAHLSQSEIDRLVPNFCVGETYFFRDSRVFDYLRTYLWNRPGKVWNLWSAACSSGEEAYTLAILLQQIQRSGEDRGQVLGTDINPLALGRARKGIYTAWSFRDCPAQLRQQYFQEVPGGWQVSAALAAKVRFQPINLVAGGFPAPLTGLWDVIFCRNVLMYLAEEQAREVIRGLHQLLVPQGLLFLSPTDAFFLSDGLFEAIPELGSLGWVKSEPSRSLTLPYGPPAELESYQPPRNWEPPREAKFVDRQDKKEQALALRTRALRLLESTPREALKASLAGLELEPWSGLGNYLAATLYLQGGDGHLARRHFQRSLDALQALSPEAALEESDFTVAQLLQLVRRNLQRLDSGT